MKATGIVRRIDELGRVVIPKEIRRNLRIREGEPLEIFTGKEGTIILLKYAPLETMIDLAKDCTASIFRATGHIACITDRDKIIAVSGAANKEYVDKPISQELEEAIGERMSSNRLRVGNNRMLPVTSEGESTPYLSQAICPIVVDGDPMGAILLLSREPNAVMDKSDLRVVETIAAIVGSQIGM